jgi:hypothetical protein
MKSEFLGPLSINVKKSPIQVIELGFFDIHTEKTQGFTSPYPFSEIQQ